jgi:channel protein (hemolysin III family)
MATSNVINNNNNSKVVLKATPRKKAALRGVSHQFAAVAAAVAGLLLTLDAPPGKAQIGCLIYTVSLTLMFTISATYHVPTWGIQGRNIMRKLDHVGIYCIIAGASKSFFQQDVLACLSLSQKVFLLLFADIT